MPFTAEHDAFILMAHFRSGTRNEDGTWSYSFESCLQQYSEAFPGAANMDLDAFRRRRKVIIARFHQKKCICKTKPPGRPAVVTEEVVADVRRRIIASPNKSLTRLAAETGKLCK